jgi:hypothetical protein
MGERRFYVLKKEGKEAGRFYLSAIDKKWSKTAKEMEGES